MDEEVQRHPKGWLRGRWRLIGLTLVGIGMAAGIAGMLRPSPAVAEMLPRLVLIPGVVDFGTIRKSAGKAEATFTLRNDGQAPLRIQRIVPT